MCVSVCERESKKETKPVSLTFCVLVPVIVCGCLADVLLLFVVCRAEPSSGQGS